MARLEFLIVLLVVVFTIYSLIDCILAEHSRVRALPKLLWALIIILLAPFGGILWFSLGKERKRPVQSVARGGQRAPDDDPAFLRSLGQDKERDERIRELEARLAELDDDHDDPKK
jgi:hypothetical protein